jgi:hypothetical protein
MHERTLSNAEAEALIYGNGSGKDGALSGAEIDALMFGAEKKPSYNGPKDKSNAHLSDEEISALLAGCPDYYDHEYGAEKPVSYPVYHGPQAPNTFIMRGYVIRGLLGNKMQKGRS